MASDILCAGVELTHHGCAADRLQEVTELIGAAHGQRSEDHASTGWRPVAALGHARRRARSGQPGSTGSPSAAGARAAPSCLREEMPSVCRAGVLNQVLRVLMPGIGPRTGPGPAPTPAPPAPGAPRSTRRLRTRSTRARLARRASCWKRVSPRRSPAACRRPTRIVRSGSPVRGGERQQGDSLLLAVRQHLGQHVTRPQRKRDWNDATGCTASARLISSTETSDSPMCRALPAASRSGGGRSPFGPQRKPIIRRT
jgi:hypothetical protein